jgi:putative membrane protein
VSGVAAGIAGGLAGAYLMNRFHAAWGAAADSLSPGPGGQKQPAAPPQVADGQEDEPATARAADAVAQSVFDHRLTADEKRVAGPAVHYLFGAIMGGVYGGLAERARRATALGGVPFGTTLWLFADEIGVPAAGLAPPSTASPLGTHVRALLAHVVYGLTTEGVRRGLRAAL